MFTPKKMIQIGEHMFLRTQNWFVCFLASPVQKYVDKWCQEKMFEAGFTGGPPGLQDEAM